MKSYVFQLSATLNTQSGLGALAIANGCESVGTTGAVASQKFEFLTNVGLIPEGAKIPSSGWTQVYEDDDPQKIVDVDYLPYAQQGALAFWYGTHATAVAWANGNLVDWQYVTDTVNTFIFGILNSSKTDFYDPLATVSGAQVIAPNPNIQMVR